MRTDLIYFFFSVAVAVLVRQSLFLGDESKLILQEATGFRRLPPVVLKTLLIYTIMVGRLVRDIGAVNNSNKERAARTSGI